MSHISTPKTSRTGLRKREIALLIFIALFFDMLSLVPGAYIVADAIAQIIIPLIFSRYDVNVFSYKRFLPYLIATISELIPGINVIPAFTLEVIVIAWLSRKNVRRI